MPERFVYFAFLFGLGAIIGSFLNVCIHRIPKGLSIVRPGSHCPVCRSKIKPWDNIPVLSYLMLRGRCRVCDEKISPRYLVVELATAFLFVFGGMFFEPGWELFFPLFFLSMVLSSIMTDLELRIIPDRFSLTGLVVGAASPLLTHRGWLDVAGGALAGGGSLLLVALAYKWLRGIDGMGGGDVKMAAMIGAFLGLKGVFYSILFASVGGSLFGIASILLRRGTMKTELPFGVFLGISSLIVLFWSKLTMFGPFILRLG